MHQRFRHERAAFLASLDEPYFESDTVNSFQSVGIYVHTAKRQDWSKLRLKLGRSRRFSPYYVAQERARLDRFRKQVRLVQLGVDDVIDDVPIEECNALFTVGQRVQVVHPLSGHLRLGTVSAVKHSCVSDLIHKNAEIHYVVNLDSIPHSEAAECVTIQDTEIAVAPVSSDSGSIRKKLLCQEPLQMLRSVVASDFHAESPPFPHAESDTLLLATLLNLLNRKQVLIEHMKLMNSCIKVIYTLFDNQLYPATDVLSPSLKPDQPPTLYGRLDVLKQRYAWTVLQLEKTSSVLAAAMLRLQARRTSSQPVKSLLPFVAKSSSSSAAGLISNARTRCEKLVNLTVHQLVMERKVPNNSSLLNINGQRIRQQIADLLTLAIVVQRFAEGKVLEHEMNIVLAALRPTEASNMRSFERICAAIDQVKANVLVSP